MKKQLLSLMLFAAAMTANAATTYWQSVQDSKATPLPRQGCQGKQGVWLRFIINNPGEEAISFDISNANTTTGNVTFYSLQQLRLLQGRTSQRREELQNYQPHSASLPKALEWLICRFGNERYTFDSFWAAISRNSTLPRT